MANRTIEDDQLSVYHSLDNMRAYVFNQYVWNTPYEVQAWQYLTGDQNHSSGANLALNIMLDIITAVVAAAGVATQNPIAGVAAGFIASFVKEWGIGKGGPPPDLNDAFADFGASYTAKSIAIVNRLDQLRGDLDQTDKPTSVIKNWELEFEFGGTTHKLRDLATAEWPAVGHDKWDAMRDAGMSAFKKEIWRTIISGGACQYYEPYTDMTFVPRSDDARDKGGLKVETADYYRKYPGFYVRATWARGEGVAGEDYVPPRWIPRNWTLGPGRYPFPPKACEILFKDGIPGQIINEGGLFTRLEVFNNMYLPHPDWGDTEDV